MNLPPSPPPSSAYSYAGPNYYSPTPTRWKNLRKLVPYVVTFVLGAGFGAAGASMMFRLSQRPPRRPSWCTHQPLSPRLSTARRQCQQLSTRRHRCQRRRLPPHWQQFPLHRLRSQRRRRVRKVPEAVLRLVQVRNRLDRKPTRVVSTTATARRLVMPVWRRSIEGSPVTGVSWTAITTA